MTSNPRKVAVLSCFSRTIGNFIPPTCEVVITSLSHSSALLLERTEIMVDGAFISSFLPIWQECLLGPIGEILLKT